MRSAEVKDREGGLPFTTVLVWEYYLEGGVRVCGDAVLRYFGCGFAVIFIFTRGIAVSKH